MQLQLVEAPLRHVELPYTEQHWPGALLVILLLSLLLWAGIAAIVVVAFF